MRITFPWSKRKACKCGATTMARHAELVDKGWKLHVYRGPK